MTSSGEIKSVRLHSVGNPSSIWTSKRQNDVVMSELGCRVKLKHHFHVKGQTTFLGVNCERRDKITSTLPCNHKYLRHLEVIFMLL